MKNRIIATRSGNQITAIINGDSFSVTSDTREESVTLYKVILALKSSGTDQDVEKLKEILAPGYKVNSALSSKLQKDRAGNYYLGTNIPLPTKLLETIMELLEDGLPIAQIEKFWKLLCLNPNDHVRDGLFKFMDRFNMPITDNGYFIAYKSVAWKGEKDRDLGVYISKEYVAKKASGRSTEGLMVIEYGKGVFGLKTEAEFEEEINTLVSDNKELAVLNEAEEFLSINKPNEFKVASASFKNKEEIIEFAKNYGWEVPADSFIANKIIEDSEWESLGLLDDLFKDLSSMFDYNTPTFTDWHTQKSTITLGKPVSMPMEECDTDPNATCSSGLHVGAPGYVSRFGRGESNYILACLVNPMNVAAIPYDYDYEKMRTSEYLPYAICEFKDGKIQEIDTKYFEDDYINYEKEMLENMSADIDDSTEEGKEQKSLISQRLVELG